MAVENWEKKNSEMNQWLPDWLEMADDGVICTDEVCATERQSLYYSLVATEAQGILNLPELSKHWIVPVSFT